MTHEEPPGVSVALIGLRGSGKSTLGPDLAEHLGFQFIDTDDDVLARFEEASFVDVMEAHGEAAWRAAEQRVAGELIAQSDRVLAMGGGMPCIPGVQEAIRGAKAAGQLIVIYLSAEPALLQGRLVAVPGDRSSLTGRGLIEEISVLHDERDPIYRSLADITCPVCDESARETSARLLGLIGGSFDS